MKLALRCYGPTLDRALKIAMEYLVRSGLTAEDSAYAEEIAATIIGKSRRAGARHPIRLANDAIVALEGKGSMVDIIQLYPRFS